MTPYTEREISITMTGEQWAEIARAAVRRDFTAATPAALTKFLEVIREEAAKR